MILRGRGALYVSLLVGVALLHSCAKYNPRPLDPPRLEKNYRERSLADERLRAFVESNITTRPSQWPPALLDLPLLTALAFYFSPEIDVARAGVKSAEAEVVTAGGRVNPSLSAGAGRTNSPESALVFRFDLAFTIETAGKRALRVLLAQKHAEAARAELDETAWRVHSRVREALLAHVAAVRRLALFESEVAIRSEYQGLLGKRLEAGEVSRPDVTSAEIETSTASLALRAAEGRVAETRAELATAVGVPMDALGSIPVQWQGWETLLQLEELPLERVQKAGLLHRADVRRSLLEYAATEAALRLEIARQYPDVDLTPGYGFDEGHHQFTIGPSFALPVVNRNKGPIAEAEARRQQGAVLFVGLQARAIGEMERRLALYRAALAEFSEADRRLAQIKGEREASVRRALAAGEQDRLALTGARLESAVAARLRLDALEQVYFAFGALEDAVQQPLSPGLVLPVIAPENPRETTEKGGMP